MKKLTDTDIIKIVEEDNYKVNNIDYSNGNRGGKIHITCPENHSYEVLWRVFRRGARCRQCRSESTKKDINEIIESISLEKYTLISKKYVNNTSKLKIKCNKDHSYNASWKEWKMGNRCPQCWEDRRYPHNSFSLEKAKDILKSLNLTYISGDYENIDSILIFKDENGKIGKKSLKNIQKSPYAINRFTYSKPQEEIKEYILKLNFNIRYNDRIAIKPKELDIYIKEKSFAIEFNGLYWHSEAAKKGYRHHTDKYKQCKEKNIKLFAIYSDEWFTKKDLVKAMIRYRLGILPKTKLRASKLEIRKLNKNKEFKDFFEEFHLDGHTQASFAYGLFYNDIMVSLLVLEEMDTISA